MSLDQIDPLYITGAAALLALICVALGLRATARGQQARDLSRRLAETEARLAEERSAATARSGELELLAEQLRSDLSAARIRAERREEAAENLSREVERVETLRADLAEKLEETRIAHGTSEREISRLRTEITKDREAADREIQTLQNLREEMTSRFRELASQTLKVQGEDFAKANQQKLNELLAPFKEHVGNFQIELRNVHKSADEERARLKEQIATLHSRSEEISREAVNLTQALKGDKQRQGAWGEMILERILEESGLERDVHYEVQASRRDEEGARWRPDVVVRMPQGKSLVIDSKVSLIAYEAATNADTEEERKRALTEHVRAVRTHIETLAAKGYQALEAGSVDYVLMFMPIEGALSEALRVQGDLTAMALRKGIGIVTPTTMMVTLRTVEHIWAVERRESNAEAIADRAGKLYDKFVGVLEEFDKIGSHLDNARDAHSRAVDRLARGRGNVLGQVDKLRTLGARTDKRLPMDHDSAPDDDGGRPALTDQAAE
ncbi:DNA recombination protein RmuC [Tropicimonas sp. IMCC34011]|uniref:DNA recombination protein RmuC n=1 Tax=Tropicimonas sp. IMCC34011 TaxID=2248759 RepID=UPI000E21F9BB|nr:DNA recombination protein RmuC [Tropicimonas sp. IMCC34011]